MSEGAAKQDAVVARGGVGERETGTGMKQDGCYVVRPLSYYQPFIYKGTVHNEWWPSQKRAFILLMLLIPAKET